MTFQTTTLCVGIIWKNPSEHPLYSHIWHTCQQGYCPQSHQTQNLFEQSIHAHVYPLQVPQHHLPSDMWHGLAPPLSVAFAHKMLIFWSLLTCAHMCQNHGSPRDHILFGHLVKHCLCILECMQVQVHSNDKNLECMHASSQCMFFPARSIPEHVVSDQFLYIGTCIENPH
jgi:hypothetical protein